MFVSMLLTVVPCFAAEWSKKNFCQHYGKSLSHIWSKLKQVICIQKYLDIEIEVEIDSRLSSYTSIMGWLDAITLIELYIFYWFPKASHLETRHLMSTGIVAGILWPI